MEDITLNVVMDNIKNVGFPIYAVCWMATTGKKIIENFSSSIDRQSLAFEKLTSVLVSKPCIGQSEILKEGAGADGN